jgi:hypothetical protein
MDVVTHYLEFCLRLGRHIDGIVDAYYGPPEIAERVEAEELREPSSLVRDAAALLSSLEDDKSGREPSRLAALPARRARDRRAPARGRGDGYEDEVERCYGVRPEWVPEDAFETVHRQLDEVLPGPGSLAERYQAWHEEDGLRGEELATVFMGLADDFRARTQAMVGLPEGESVEVQYVSDKPWAAFNYARAPSAGSAS